MADRTVTTDLIGRDKMSPAFNSAGKSAEKNAGVMGKLGGALKTGVKVGALAAGGGILALGGWLAQGVKDAGSYQTVLAKTAQVLKTTGGASGQTVEGIKNQAAALETLSGVDEELIVNSQNVLATFTNIRNVGKNKIFDQATASALDMSQALGTSLQGASILVGKALNDPIKGITALSKSGVSFSESQKKTIAALVKTGDTAGAQKIILKELNKEFGGAAKAAGAGIQGDYARFQDVLADTGRTIGQALLPAITKATKWLGNNLPKAIAIVQDDFGRFKDAFTDGADWEAHGGIEVAGKKVRLFVDFIRDDAIPTVKTIVSTLKDWAPVLVPLAAGVGAIAVAVKIATTSMRVWAAVTRIVAGAQAALNLVMAANPIGLVILAIVGLTAALVVAYKRSETFRLIVNGVFKAVANYVLSNVSLILGAFGKFFGVLGRLPGKAGAAFRSAARAAINAKNKVDDLRGAINKLPSKKRIDITIWQTYNQRGKGAGTYGQGLGVIAPKKKKHRARGGSVMRGEEYIVNEVRQEVFVPSESGTILPSVPDWGGGGDTYNIYVTEPLGTPEATGAHIVRAMKAYKAHGRSVPAGTFGTA